MSRANYFRNNAESSSINARLASEPPERALWLMRAQRWLQLANKAETKADDEPLTQIIHDGGSSSSPPVSNNLK